MEDERRDFNMSFLNPGSEPKSFSGVKRLWKEGEEAPGLLKKCAKMLDLESVISSDGRGTSCTSHKDNSRGSSMPIDLNIESCTPSNMIVNGVNVDLQLVNPLPSSTKSTGFEFDLNVGDVSSSNNEPFHSCNKDLKLKDKNECMSSVGPSDKKDPMKVWNEMKQNGFLSSSHGGVPVPMPKRRGRKKKTEGIKNNNMELAKKEQMDRFAKITAPSGLLNELNPGIINHVRNSKQVHSIMEALVKSEKHKKQHEVSKERDQLKSTKGSGLNRCTVVSPEIVVSLSEFAKTEQMSVCPAPASENNNGSLCNEESANLARVTSLSFSAANVASLWLKLLHQDIKGRLAALEHSKKRVQAVIQTELPCLLSQEFPPLKENQSRDKKSNHYLAADAHRTRWTTLFDQMDKTLSQEESQLESWLNQIREMQVLCDNGLMKYHDLYGMQQHGLTENDRLNTSGFLEKDSSVLAAAASIYSTCNFLSSMENLPCC